MEGGIDKELGSAVTDSLAAEEVEGVAAEFESAQEVVSRIVADEMEPEGVGEE